MAANIQGIWGRPKSLTVVEVLIHDGEQLHDMALVLVKTHSDNFEVGNVIRNYMGGGQTIIMTVMGAVLPDNVFSVWYITEFN